jgi:hypothetical protein
MKIFSSLIVYTLFSYITSVLALETDAPVYGDKPNKAFTSADKICTLTVANCTPDQP